MKYSAFATNVTFRLTISGMKIESENDRWLLAMIAGPVSGTFALPSTCGRKISLSQGPRMTYLSSQYSTGVLSERVPRVPRPASRGGSVGNEPTNQYGTPQRTPGTRARRVTIQGTARAISAAEARSGAHTRR